MVFNYKRLERAGLLMTLIFLLVTDPSIAYEIKIFNTEIEVYNDGVSKVINDIIIDTTNIKETFSIPAYSPESVIVRDDKGELKFATLGTNIIIEPRARTEDYKITIQYLTNTLTSKNGDGWSLSYLIPAYKKIKAEKINSAGLILSLPNTATINSFSDNGIIFTENSNLKIGWKLSLDENKDTTIQAEYHNKINRKVDYIKIAFYSLLSIILMVALVFCIRYGYCKITKRLTKGKKDILKTLDSREKDVINLLLENNNQVYQSKIQKDTSISKATLSRIIKRLESRNIIEVRPSGNTNLIIVQDWFVKK